MGGLDDRRGAALAELASHLWDVRADIRVMSVDRPIDTGTPDAVFGDDKYRLLSNSKLLLNIHRDRPDQVDHPPYFEWARAVEAMANGCVILSEPSVGHEPLAPGSHFIETPLDDMGSAVRKLLADDSQRAEVAERAREAVFGELTLANALAPLLERIEADVLFDIPAHAKSSASRKGTWRLGLTQGSHPVRLGPFRPFARELVAAKRIAMAENRALQRLDAAACMLTNGSRQHITRSETPWYEGATPEVSVVVSLYNYADVVVETLRSIADSEGVAFEVIVVEDHATDASRTVVRKFINEHPIVPIVLIAKDANEGL